MTYLEQLRELLPQLPLLIVEDVNKRVDDWLKSGGNENDKYIEQQLKYVKAVIRAGMLK